jgi:hypothetical protein
MATDVDIHPLAKVALGDLVTLPDGRRLTARARVSLPVPEGTMAAFIICGELEVLLSLPTTRSAPVSVYVPIPYLPEGARTAKVVFEGVTSYWAPHLPGLTGAMGELTFRVLRVRNTLDPVVLVYRGSEPIVFVKASEADLSDLHVQFMPRSADNDVNVTRHSALVGVHAPVSVPVRSLTDAARR